MRILLDECVNPRLKAAFAGHDISTVAEMGWQGLTNGKLLDLAEQSFRVFVTIDQSLEHQQNLRKRKLGILVVKVPDNKLPSYQPIFAELKEAAEMLSPGALIHVEGRP